MVSATQVQIRKLALLAMITALAVALRVTHVIPIPNMQPVTDILMIVTLNLGLSFGIAMAALVMIISNVFLGLGIWTLPQIAAYIACVLVVWVLAKISFIRKHVIALALVAGSLGYVYGFVVNLGMSIWGGIPAFIAYTAGSLLFDTYHVIGNFIFFPILYKPLTIALERFTRGLK